MPVTTPTNPPDPKQVINNLKSPNTASFINNFLATSTIVFTSNHSTYEPGPLNNNIAGPGTMSINPRDATDLSNALPNANPWMSAYQSIILHELGHAFYATRSNTAYSGDPAKRVEWCYEREALASLFVFNYINEMGLGGEGTIVVPGPGAPADLYGLLLSSVTGKTPGSLAYENAVIAAAKAKFKGSARYRAYCEAWAAGGGLPPAYYPPPPPPGSSGGGGGGGGGAGTTKIPGGYWEPVPSNPSD
jgi:hypothetical protein